MIRLVFVLFTVFSWQFIIAQSLNDNCENATDITAELFNFSNFPESCNSIIGTNHISFAYISDFADHPTVDAPVYSSQGCIGYKPETTDDYPDIWYKSKLHDDQSIYFQNVFFWGGDTIQIAVYFGQCGALYQSQCFTLSYADSVYWQGALLEYYPHNPGDDIYIQIKVPPQYNDFVGMCFSDGEFGVIYYNFVYDRPAGTNGINQLNLLSHHLPIIIYPNPSNNLISIQADDPILSYSIADLQGIVRFKNKGTKNHESVNISELPIGMYVITVRTEMGMGMSKFFKL